MRISLQRKKRGYNDIDAKYLAFYHRKGIISFLSFNLESVHPATTNGNEST